MKFLRNLIGKKRDNQTTRRPAGVDQLEKSYHDTIGALDTHQVSEAAVSDILSNVNTKVKAPAPQADAAIPTAANIWDVEESAASTELPSAIHDVSPAAAAASAARSPARARRTKTRLIGFEKSDGDVVDLFTDSPKAPVTQRAKFPVGWIVVADGPGRGEAFSLVAGMSQIGRGEDQAIQLDFGDNSISRTGHAAIVYDPETKEFLLGHGGKSNIVRLNDKPLISNEVLKTGDVIRIGETVLRFVALCDQSFSWTNGETGEDEDVAIA